MSEAALELIEAANLMLEAFGGDVPAWLQPHAERLAAAAAALETVGDVRQGA